MENNTKDPKQIDLEDSIEEIKKEAMAYEPTKEEMEAEAAKQIDDAKHKRHAQMVELLPTLLRVDNEFTFHTDNYKCKITTLEAYVDGMVQTLEMVAKEVERIMDKS